MKFHKTINKTLLFTLISFVGCSTTPPVKEFSSTANIGKEIQKLDEDIDLAAQNQVHILSPNNFKKAQSSLEDARTGALKQKDKKDILHEVTVGRAYLKEANKSADLARNSMQDVVIARQDAIDSGAPWSFAKDFNNTDKKLLEITSEIENNVLDNIASNRSTLLSSYRDLETQTIKKEYLSDTELKIKKTIDEGTETMTSLTAKNQSDIMLEQSVTESQASQNKELETEKDFNEKLEEIKNRFSKDEAEVYQQDDTLTIRLKGLEFPSSQAALKDSNFPLLGKVQQVIREFDNSSVIVEGHTDASGPKKTNAQLSQDRAQAVREYLLSIDAISADKIKAIGVGEQKPLATNKTASGRALNRRVDVLIKVQKNPKL